jgi:hypothetical protein
VAAGRFPAFRISDRQAVTRDRTRLSSRPAARCIDQHRAGPCNAAFEFKETIASIDGLIDGRARIDGAAVSPEAFIEGLASVTVGLFDQSLLPKYLISLTFIVYINGPATHYTHTLIYVTQLTY